MKWPQLKWPSTEAANFIRMAVLDALCFMLISLTFLAAIFMVIQPQASDEGFLTTSNVLPFLLFSFSIGCGFSYFLRKADFQTLGVKVFQKNRTTDQIFWKIQLAVVLILLFVVGCVKTKFSLIEVFNIDGLQGAKRLFVGLLTPKLSIVPEAVLNVIETIFMAFMATAIAVPIAFVLSFLASKNIMKGRLRFTIYLVLRTLLNFFRSIEALLWAIIFSVWVGIGPFAGMLALMIHSIASLAKQYSEMIESVDEKPVQGVLSCGASEVQTIWYAIVPQVFLQFTAFTVYRWDINVRMATIIGLVGGGGIGTMLIRYQGQAMWSEVGAIILVIAIIVWFMDQASAVIRETLK